jgi:AcrR family transcriptional regulator
MPLKNTKDDRRSNRTKRSLSEALVELIHEKRFDDITVQEVIDRADVGRSTFYSHFRDKEDLFQKDWEQFLDMFAAHIDWEKAGRESFVPVVFLFAHLKEYQPFYQGLVRSRKTDAVFKSGVSYLSQKIETALTLRFKGQAAPSLPIPILSNYLAAELFALLKWWLDHEMPYPPERMDEIFHALMTPTFQAIFGSAA